MLPLNQILHGNALDILKQLPEESADLVVTSPPYYRLRRYPGEAEVVWGGREDCAHEFGEEGFCAFCGAWRGQLGQEPTPDHFVQHLAAVFDEVRRVLKRSGSLYLNIGDTFSEGTMLCIPERLLLTLLQRGWLVRGKIIWEKTNALPESVKSRFSRRWEYVYHLVRDDCRSDYCIPGGEPPKEKYAEKHERWEKLIEFWERAGKPVLKKEEIPEELIGEVRQLRYYFALDCVREPHKTSSIERYLRAVRFGRNYADGSKVEQAMEEQNVGYPKTPPKSFLRKFTKHDTAVGRTENFSYPDPLHVKEYHPLGKNPGDVWHLPTRHFKEAHFAVFSVDLPARAILASCPPDGVVLDPFCGSGTVPLACELINRAKWHAFKFHIPQAAKRLKWELKWIGIEVCGEYVKMARRRIRDIASQKQLHHFLTGEV